MNTGESRPTGEGYLAAVTFLLQAMRLADPDGGLWEAADAQWWYRHDQHLDERRQVFFSLHEGDGGAVVFSEWPHSVQCDFFLLPGASVELLRKLTGHAARTVEALADRTIDLFVLEGDETFLGFAEGSGFDRVSEEGVISWLAAADRPGVPPLPDGFVLRSRQQPDGVHPMAKRNGPRIESLLGGCSLYQPALDLAIYTEGGEPVCYGLFWPDPVTKVGLVEPMRTEDTYQGRGLAGHLFASGLELLARAGCERLKVSFDPENEPARRLYLGAGFTPRANTVTLRRPASAGQ